MPYKATAIALITVVLSAIPAEARPIPSHLATHPPPAAGAREAVSERLASLGLTPAEVRRYVTLMSSEDLRQFSENVDQLQIGGMNRTAKWIAITAVAIIVVAWLIDQAGSPYAW